MPSSSSTSSSTSSSSLGFLLFSSPLPAVSRVASPRSAFIIGLHRFSSLGLATITSALLVLSSLLAIPFYSILFYSIIFRRILVQTASSSTTQRTATQRLSTTHLLTGRTCSILHTLLADPAPAPVPAA